MKRCHECDQTVANGHLFGCQRMRAEEAEARVAELEGWIRRIAESAHDAECDCDRGPCTCLVGPARVLLRLDPPSELPGEDQSK